ncbi:MAG TPA: monovalent cation/H+ antiporter complex subunit F [Mycobacteriales bacterium]|nr:monovalent cation/H+ antiporter complex subunit F [Mycobacteriales bacterium]
MNAYLLAAAVVLFGGMTPAMGLATRGDPVHRLFGVELLTGTSVVVLMLLAKGYGQSAYLIVPLVLVPLSFAGTLVYTRLLGPPSRR